MKKVIIYLVLCTFLVTTAVPEAFGQTRRKKKKYRGVATNVAIVAGSTAAGALIGRGRN